MKHVHIFDHDLYHNVLKQQIGHGLPVFVGHRQKGAGLGSILGFIGRYALPLLSKYVLPHAATAVENIAGDIIGGKNVKESMRKHGITMLKNVGKSVATPQQGAGLRVTKRNKKVSIQSVNKDSTPGKQKNSSSKSFKRSKKKKLTKFDIFG